MNSRPLYGRSPAFVYPAVLLFAITLIGGGSTEAQTAAAEAMRTRVEALALEPRIGDSPVADAWFLIRFYERRQFSPAWDSDAKLDALVAALAGSKDHGLDPNDYHLAALREQRELQRREPSPETGIHLDILATDAMARYAFHLRFGKVNPEAIEPTWNFSRTLEGTSPVSRIQGIIDTPDFSAALQALAPQEPGYTQLMQQLRVYRELSEAGGWPEVPGRETLRAGMRSTSVALLRERLGVEGRLTAAAADDDAELFDAVLEEAVMKFQRLHGLEPDGVVGARSFAALNIAVDARIDQLRVNLERMRWIFRDLEARYIVANIARFQASLIENDEIVWTTRAVVGLPFRQTPVFRARMTYLVLNPTWTVPPGILRADLLPEIRRDPAALARRNMKVLDMAGQEVDPGTVDWSGAGGFPYMLRQQPGPANALGRVKFMFPNPHHVYMHDTPSRDLFARSDRSFSSGCIRLENPIELAELLLRESPQWDAAAIDAALADGRERTVNLARPLTVLLIYGTAVAEAGEMYFLPDVYNRDAALLQALNAEFEFSAPAGYEESLLANVH